VLRALHAPPRGPAVARGAEGVHAAA